MDSANWMMAIGDAVRLFVQSIPDAVWLAYEWAKDWQIVLGGLAILIAAKIFAQGSVRSARIRAAASVRAAQIAAGVMPKEEESSSALDTPPLIAPTFRSSLSRPVEEDLSHKLDQLRSYIRSAMALQAADVDGSDMTGNIYCERIARLRFDESDLPRNPSANTLELYKKLLLQMAALRRSNEKGQSSKELSEALFQLNARARELAAAIKSIATPSSSTRQPGQVRV